MSRVVDKLNLRKLILFLCMFSVAITLLNAFYTVYRVQKELILSNTMESNWVYAEKMADMTDAFIDTAMSQLNFSANILSKKIGDTQVLDNEVERLRLQTNAFNSVVVVDSKGTIIAISPETLELKGVTLKQDAARQSLNARAPLITDPFVSPSGNYITSISHPIYSEAGEYLGYVSGTLYLERQNILTRLLGKHSHQDGSYMYVVDRNKTIIYHPDKRRVGQVILNNEAINAVVNREDGYGDIVNSQGVDMLAGYAPVKNSGWGVIVQKPKNNALNSLNDLMFLVFWKGFPIGVLTLMFIWGASILISRPLWQLASAATKIGNYKSTISDLNRIHAWYFEALHLRRSFLNAMGVVSNTIDKLHSDTLTDALTGALNRRGLDKTIEQFQEQNRPFSLLALDIDHFKRVNDTFGHHIGDELIKSLSKIMKEEARAQDVVCRSGGEEFIIFLANTNPTRAYDVAERIRRSIEAYHFDTVGNVTISIGVSHWKGQEDSIHEAIKNADNALYKAKRNGRNRTEL